MKTNAKKVVTFGEIMMRLNPPGNQRFRQCEGFEASYAGGEANVAVSLANYGMKASFVTKVPAHEIGQCALDALRKYGVDTDDCPRGGSRLGVYFVEKGASQRPSKVIYDRAYSAISLAEPEDFESDEVRDFAASVLIYDHKQYERREKRGAKVNISGVKQGIKTAKFRKRLKAFLLKVFPRKKGN